MLRRNSFSCCSNGSVSGTASLCLNPEKYEGCEGEEGVWRGCGGGEEGVRRVIRPTGLSSH